MNPTKKLLFISPSIVKKYNATASFVFAQIAYHAVRHGKYDTAHIATANYSGVAKSTVIKYIKLFVKDNLLIGKKGQDFHRDALVFNYNDSEDAKALYHSYAKQINKVKAPEAIQLESLVMVDVNLLESDSMANMKAERARSLLIYKNLLIDKFASGVVNNKGDVLTLGKWSAIARLFGCAVNTAKSIIQELSDNKLLTLTKNRTIVTARYLTKLSKAINAKAKSIKDFLKAKFSEPAPKPKESSRSIPRKNLFKHIKRQTQKSNT